MEVRCGSCNKLFRVSDDKITGRGVKFKCTRCQEYVKITREDFETYQLTHGGPSLAEAAVLSEPAGHYAEPAAPEFVLAGSPAVAEEAAQQATGVDFGMRDLSPSSPSGEEEKPPVITPVPLRKAEEAPLPHVPPLFEPAPVAAPPAEAAPARERGRAAAGRREVARKAKQILSQPIHPLVSGGFSGALGGLAAAIIMIIIMIATDRFVLRSDLLAKIPDYVMSSFSILAIEPSDRPLSVAKYIGFGIFFGMLIAFLQTVIEKNVFAGFGLFVGTTVSAIIGSVLAFTTGAGGDDPVYVLAMIVAWAMKGFLITLMLVIVRRIALPLRTESFDIRVTATQGIVAAFSIVLMATAFYAEYAWMLDKKAGPAAGSMITKAAYSVEGLSVSNLRGEIDPATQDLVISGIIENSLDAPKPYWHVQAEVYNAQNAVLITARLANGKQMYTQRDYDVLARRGTDVNHFRRALQAAPEIVIPPRGAASFEIRVLEPPIGIATFTVQVKPFERGLLSELRPR